MKCRPFWQNLPQSINVYFGHPTNLLKRYSSFANHVGAKMLCALQQTTPLCISMLSIIQLNISNNNLDYLSSNLTMVQTLLLNWR